MSFTLEELLAQMISQYQQSTFVPSGHVMSAPYMNSDGAITIKILPLTPVQNGYPANFGDFVQGAKNHGMSATDAFPWLSQKSPKVQSLHSSTLNRSVHLPSLEVHEILIRVKKRHALYMITRGKTEPVEVDTTGHNMLICSKTGIVVDFSLGQFTGSMAPKVYPDWDSFQQDVPGVICRKWKTLKEAIQQQLYRDSNCSSLPFHPDHHPQKFTARVVRAAKDRDQYCLHCFGTRSPLLRCSRCQSALYCCRECQTMDWKAGHKLSCESHK